MAGRTSHRAGEVGATRRECYDHPLEHEAEEVHKLTRGEDTSQQSSLPIGSASCEGDASDGVVSQLRRMSEHNANRAEGSLMRSRSFSSPLLHANVINSPWVV